MELEERVGTDEDEVDEERQLVLRHVTTSDARARSIEVGKIGAFAFEQREGKGKSSEEGCHLIEFIGLQPQPQHIFLWNRRIAEIVSTSCQWGCF